MITYRKIDINQNWQSAFNNWFATQAEKRAFKEQFLMIQSTKIDTNNVRSIDSYFCQIKNNKLPIHQETETFANQFFGINRKNQ